MLGTAAGLQAELGVLGAAGLCVHSFLDGVAIGISFQANPKIGFLIAVAIIAHDFSDGLNTVTVVLAHGNPVRRSVAWLGASDLLPEARTHHSPLVGIATAAGMGLIFLITRMLPR
jgi:ZIP family zinc transporter